MIHLEYERIYRVVGKGDSFITRTMAEQVALRHVNALDDRPAVYDRHEIVNTGQCLGGWLVMVRSIKNVKE
jgi:hypothetical protein